MSANSHDERCSEYVSGLAVALLDELRITLMECRLMLTALPDEADMNFDDLDYELHTVQRSAHQAYQAASLVHQGARLDPRWGTDWSRPKALFARHSAAVRGGAPRLDPAPAMGGGMERALWQLPATDRVDDVPKERPTCAGTVRTTKRRCTMAALYLGSGLFAAHCYSHATPDERDQYRAHQDATRTKETTSYTDLLALRRRIGENIGQQWLQRRDRRTTLFDEAHSTTTNDQDR